MSDETKKLEDFLEYVALLKGDEKGEAQVYCDRLFQAFGHKGYKEAGAELEFRIKKKSSKGTSFADLIWKPRLLLEMKKRGENLYHHYQQAFDYWIHAVPDRPRYVVLCNFDEFWIYDFDKQIDEPVDVVAINDLSRRYPALNFLFPDDPDPVFGNDLEAVSREAADKVAQLFNSLIDRGVDRAQAQRFALQIVVAMFAEDIGLLPASIVYNLVSDCLHKGQSPYDLFGGLFQQMNSEHPAKGGRFAKVPYFNGGIFSTIEPIELNDAELDLIGGEDGAATKDWSKVNPAIFGTIFQQSMDAEERHAYGAHFTSEADIMRIVTPTIARPWRDRIAKASSMKDLLALRSELMNFRVLDPACGSGNFLYLSYRELVRVEIALLAKLKATVSAKNFQEQAKTISLVSPRQFFGIDRDSFGVELAKVTLMLAKKLALDEAIEVLEREQIELPLHGDEALPLDNLDDNIRCDDALFSDWPEVDAIVGNPPYQSKNKMQQELGRAYVNEVRDRFPDVDGRADYCVYWFRKAHDELEKNQRAGLVGTNTIRQNYSRTGGLDYIVGNGGTITEAVSSMNWSGEAAVDVSIVNWIKGAASGKKRLYAQAGNDPTQGWSYRDLDTIGPSLSYALDVTQARTIQANAARGGCYQGQTHGHEGFLLSLDQAHALKAADPKSADVLFPYLIANELIGRKDSLPQRYVIDFQPRGLLEARAYKPLFAHVQERVLPDRETAAQEEEKRNKEALKKNSNARTNSHHANFLKKWWLLSYPREDMVQAVSKLGRFVVCGRVTLRPIFEFLSPEIRPNDALMVFPYEDDYSFGVLQSGIHWVWFINRCSTLTGRFRYTSNTVFDSFAWPQSPTLNAVKKVAAAAVELRNLRHKLKAEHGISFRELYRALELPGASPLVALINKIRSDVDTHVQVPRTDAIEGCVRLFIRRSDDNDRRAVEDSLRRQMVEKTGDANWSDHGSCKVLTLEHHMAAVRLGFSSVFDPLYEIDEWRTGLLDGSFPPTRFFAQNVLPLVLAQQTGDRFAVARIVRGNCPFLSVQALKAASDPRDLLRSAQAGVDALAALWRKVEPTCGQVLMSVAASKLFEIPDRLAPVLEVLQKGISDGTEQAGPDDQVTPETSALLTFLEAPFGQINLYRQYVSGLAPFDTHQGVKGREFDRVMVIMDDAQARGFMFGYEKLFGAKAASQADIKNLADGKETGIDRTRRLLYVTCSRAEKSLALVAYTEDPIAVKSHVLQSGWFSEEEIDVQA